MPDAVVLVPGKLNEACLGHQEPLVLTAASHHCWGAPAADTGFIFHGWPRQEMVSWGMCRSAWLPLVLQPHQWRGFAESRPKERKNIFLVSIQKSKHHKCLNPAKSNQHNPIKPNPTMGKQHMPTSPAVTFYSSGLYSLSFRHCQPAQNWVKLWEFKQVVGWYEKAWGW